MKRILPILAFFAGFSVASVAQATDPPPTDSVPAPPGLNDPGVAPTDMSATDAQGQLPTSDVQIRRQGDDTIEEYRRGGKLTMIRITPKNGVGQTYMADEQGRLTRDPTAGPINPVYFTLYEWK